MLFFKLFDFTWPEWMPLVGGEYFLFFGPVFNIADSSIFIGVVIILFRQKVFFKETADQEPVVQENLYPETSLENSTTVNAESNDATNPDQAENNAEEKKEPKAD
jgi:signal peptidase II